MQSDKRFITSGTPQGGPERRLQPSLRPYRNPIREGTTMILDNTRNAPAKDDADIIAAWQRMGEARQAIDALADCASEQDNALWAAFGRDEKQIQSAVASTLTGAEIQLWCNMLHLVTADDDERAALRRDLDHFAASEASHDWTVRLLFSAIRSLRAVGGAA